jgi:hypothetical protein
VTYGKLVVFYGCLVSSTYKTDCHDIAEISLKVALNTITLTLTPDEDLVFEPFKNSQL